MNALKVKALLHQFFIEDVGDQDLTSEAIFSRHETGSAEIVTKQSGVFVGDSIITEGFQLLNQQAKVQLYIKDGQYVEAGDIIAKVHGPIQAILTGERVILNLIQRMSGIATMTFQARKIMEGTHTQICDTRKTTPGLRGLEKYAVRMGGGVNHRFGLYDGVMLKDNHIAYAGSIKNAVLKVKEYIGPMVKVEVEIETLEQLKEAVEADVDIIMFDNCDPQTIKKWISQVPNHITTEASGGMNLNNIALYKDTGVDYISLGALTHSVQSLDISLNVEEMNYELV
ncbi:carboxylating nicotinate-nucleotide diphosphorylase [Priestia flexa]|uniref:nicotinate-nucleotide diphosphorylase (carboxylating) n=1 Tax=Priestia flexa TaxID=86664 RepID=A0ABU4J6J7_9BACI|nr:carboxylating nicotinate-nucleotide diphosphorylase [Priestia flexa]MBY6085266.1 carboxylating nicotinate-nucleotide diphosphorylase [Priestia flexa]MDW8516607.1 carboxylating nicotinate-nucleotide diphosphorylase [Priestia flexa]MED4588294.1 carboxylating nicotinate-nucleotide diphosphorylase [Priestia flexa]SIQ41489.1 nicotinate-nucleotide pyrophosphorylase [carboxylating] [Priestia flexa]